MVYLKTPVLGRSEVIMKSTAAPCQDASPTPRPRRVARDLWLRLALLLLVLGIVSPRLTAWAADSDSDTPPPPGPDAKYYILIDVDNRTTRPDAEVDALVRTEIQDRLLHKKKFAVAPKGETAKQSRKVLHANNLDGYQLVVQVPPADYENGTLTQRIRMTSYSWPDHALVAETTPSLSGTLGVGSHVPDRDAEDQQIGLATVAGLEVFIAVLRAQ